VVGELAHLHRHHRDLERAADEVVEADAQGPRHALVDQVERRHAHARGQLIAQEIVRANFFGIDERVGVDVAGVDGVQQRVDFFLVEDFLCGHGYCITKAVKYSASTLPASPPAPLTTARTDSSDAACSFSLPSRVEMASYFWLPSSMSRSLRMRGSFFLRISSICGSRVMRLIVICRKRTIDSASKLTTK